VCQANGHDELPCLVRLRELQLEQALLVRKVQPELWCSGGSITIKHDLLAPHHPNLQPVGARVTLIEKLDHRSKRRRTGDDETEGRVCGRDLKAIVLVAAEEVDLDFFATADCG
jgi:hypothetical protein